MRPAIGLSLGFCRSFGDGGVSSILEFLLGAILEEKAYCFFITLRDRFLLAAMNFSSRIMIWK